jgi:NAD(P)-dependent dehydrogenase (short-subunit alcohol dehydrogenase family)
MSKDIIVITGATGTQGASVAHTFLAMSTWHVRCLTRNPSSPAAQALAASGAEVIRADLSDISSLRTSFKDATAVFLNTDFWGPYLSSRDRTLAYATEVLHGRNVAIAAAEVPTLRQLVYSTLPGMKTLSGGKYVHSYHWDAKADVAEILQGEAGLRGKVSFLVMGVYATNPLFLPRLINDGEGKRTLKFTIAGKKTLRMPIIAAGESTGTFVKALIDGPAGRWALGSDSYLTMGEVVDVWKRVTGYEVATEEVNVQVMHERYNIPWEVLDAPQFIAEFGYTGSLEVMASEQLNVETKSFEKWLAERNWEEMIMKGEEALNDVSDK